MSEEMSKEFYEWLNECPTEWVREEEREEGTIYFFRNGKEGEE